MVLLTIGGAMRVLRLSLLFVCGLTAAFNFVPSSPRTDPAQALPFGLETTASRLGAPSPAVYQTPVFDRDFPDPAVIEEAGVFYSFATNSSRTNVLAARSNDLVAWSMLPDALPELAAWAQPRPNMVWAPEVIKIGGGFKMYYVAHDRASRRQCIGVATSETPAGPYRDLAPQALVCPGGFTRAIDPNPYEDRGRLYLYFSGVCCGAPNGIYVQKLSSDGLSTVGAPELLLKAEAAWEGTVAEAPTMLKHGPKYYLFYSANDYRNHTYAVGYAVCRSPAGPCTKAKENPLLATGSGSSPAIGPGHQAIIKVGRDYRMLYHGWNGVAGYDRGGRRALWLQPLVWRDGRPVLAPPSGGR
jgi:beta-xylosidase